VSTAPATQHVPIRCAGPNCGKIKAKADRWWLMWTSTHEFGPTVLSFCAWDEAVALNEAALHVCSDGCAARLLSQFLTNLRKTAFASPAATTADNHQG
jgi:hypothetical protein